MTIYISFPRRILTFKQLGDGEGRLLEPLSYEECVTVYLTQGRRDFSKTIFNKPKPKTSLPRPAPPRALLWSSSWSVCRAVMTAIPAQESLLLGGRKTASSQVALLRWPLKTDDVPRLPPSRPLGLGGKFTHRLFFLNSFPSSPGEKKTLHAS